MLGHLGWVEFLRRWSSEAIAHADDVGLKVTPERLESGWIGAPPASAADVRAAEARIERTLPSSYRQFLALTDGWPVLSMDFGELRPVSLVDWVATADPDFYRIVCTDDGYEWPPDSDDGPPLMNRALLLGTGTDYFLYDTGRVAPDGEWATTGWTSWYPGAGDQRPSFRAGMESHYARFVRFSAPDSVTHTEVAAQVDDAYQRSLRGDRSAERVIGEARSFGSTRADVLEQQVTVLTSRHRAETGMVTLARGEHVNDPAMVTDLWPMFVVAVVSSRGRLRSALDQAMRNGGDTVGALLRPLVERCEREGGLAADFGYAPAFAAAVDNARDLVRAGRKAEAFDVIIAALPSWRPLSPLHLAPMGLAWDRDLGRIMTPARREQVLATARGQGLH